MLKHTLLIGILLVAITACKKTASEPDNQTSPLQTMAKTILKMKMAPVDFASLDWSHASVKEWQGKEFLLQVPSKYDAAKSLYFSNVTGTPVYNWAKFENKTKDGKNISGTLTTIDINNQVLNKVDFVNNRVIAQTNRKLSQGINGLGLKQKIASDDDELPPVTVVTYIYQTAYDYFSLYWILNSFNEFLPFFEGSWQDAQIMDSNSNLYLIGTSFTTYATRDIMSDGSAQITSTNPGAFLLSGLNLVFTYNPATNALNTKSVVSNPVGGMFLGSWTGPIVSNIVTTSSYIEFSYVYNNTYNLVGFPFSKDYKMKIHYNIVTNEITWTWLSN